MLASLDARKALEESSGYLADIDTLVYRRVRESAIQKVENCLSVVVPPALLGTT